MSDEYVHVGRHADILNSGRHIGPGDRIINEDLHLDTDERRGEDQHLIDEGRLVNVKSFDGGHSNADHVEHDEMPLVGGPPTQTSSYAPALTGEIDEEDSHGDS